jgi:pyridoxal phosphate enzyme (YggS family)
MNYNIIQKNVCNFAIKYSKDPKSCEILVVTKQQPISKIECLIHMGHRLFGESRVQEAKAKWQDLKKKYPNIILHLIGPLQTNKISDAIALFDVIQTVDRIELAEKLSKRQKTQNKYLRYYVQVNIGRESQKFGVLPNECDKLITESRQLFDLQVDGIMCIPPINQDPTEYFLEMLYLARRNKVKNISMGMSNDYEQAIACGATMVRIGRAIFQDND